MERMLYCFAQRTWVAACAFCLAFGALQQVSAQQPAPANPLLGREDVSPAAMRTASALVEKYLLPVQPVEPTAEQKQLIASATGLLKTEQADKGRMAIEQFVSVGPAALGALHKMESPASAKKINAADLLNPDVTLSQPPAAFAAMLAPIIIRKIEAAQRQPIVVELAALGASGQAAAQLKLLDAQTQIAILQARIDATPPTEDAEALARAKADAGSLSTRVDMLMELKRLIAPPPKPAPAEPPENPADQPQELQPPLSPVLFIQPLSPPSSNASWYPSYPPSDNGPWPQFQVLGGWFVWPPLVVYPSPNPPFIFMPPFPPPHHRNK